MPRQSEDIKKRNIFPVIAFAGKEGEITLRMKNDRKDQEKETPHIC